MTSTLRSRSLAIALLILVVSLSIYGFAASNTASASGAGDGSGAVSGYDVSNIEHLLLSSDPRKLEEVSFNVAALPGAGDASDVRISADGSGTWVTCSNSGGSSWTCTFAGGGEPLISGLNALQVVAVE